MNIQDFKYIQNISADGVATLYLYDVIGKYFDEETQQVCCSIDGTAFAREIEYLQTQAKIINVRINSSGGNVLDGYAIFDAIRNSKIPVYTYNVGLCASISAIIFLAGHQRLMMDYATLMIHNPSMPTGSDSKILDVIKEQLVTILKNNSLLREEELDALMNDETFFDADEAEQNGLIDEKIITERSKPKMTKTNLLEMANVYNQLITDEMKKTNKKLKVEEEVIDLVVVTPEATTIVNETIPASTILKNKKEAAEPAEEEASETPEEEKLETEEQSKTIVDEMEEGDEDMTMEDAKKEIKALKAKVDAFEADKAKAKADKIKNMLTSFVSTKKIASTEVESLTKLAEIDFDSVFNMLSKINPAPSTINKESVKIFNYTPKINNVINGKESWTIRDWEKKDAKGLETLKNESPDTYADMYNAFYKK